MGAGWVAEHRIVFTYAPLGQSRGIVTGYELDGMFVVEHVIVFSGMPKETLLHMARAALAEATARFATIVCCVPERYPLSRGLHALAERLGFTEYARVDELIWYVVWCGAANDTDGIATQCSGDSRNQDDGVPSVGAHSEHKDENAMCLVEPTLPYTHDINVCGVAPESVVDKFGVLLSHVPHDI